MKYYKMYKETGECFEITKEEAKSTLEGWWDQKALDEIFDNDKSFRLYTPVSDVWTSQDGMVPMPGLYGFGE